MESQKKIISIIFLDIDGVLTINEEEDDRILPLLLQRGHTSTDSIPCLEYDQLILELFHKPSIQYLMKLIDSIEFLFQHEVGIVLSSDWRLNRTIPFLQRLFAKFPFGKKIIDRTPQLMNASREEEIAYWLKVKTFQSSFSSSSSSSSSSIPTFDHDVLPSFGSSSSSSFSFSSPPHEFHKTNKLENYEIYSFVILDDHDSAFSNHFLDQFIHVRKDLLNSITYESALEILSTDFRLSSQTMQTLQHFQIEKYVICEEIYEDINDLP